MTTRTSSPPSPRLTDVAQVVYLDLRDHGRSSWGDPTAWSFEQSADDLVAFCDALDITRPIVLGHSMGGFVAMLAGARHPGHAGGLVLLSTMARFDLARVVEGFRSVAGDEVAELARRSYAGETVSDGEWSRVLAAFGPAIPDRAALDRRIRNVDVGEAGMDHMRRLDLIDELARISCPTLVVVGALDPVTPVDAAREIAGALRPEHRPAGDHRRRRALHLARRPRALLRADPGVRDRRIPRSPGRDLVRRRSASRIVTGSSDRAREGSSMLHSTPARGAR